VRDNASGGWGKKTCMVMVMLMLGFSGVSVHQGKASGGGDLRTWIHTRILRMAKILLVCSWIDTEIGLVSHTDHKIYP
jgi:hypothetical protein